jgi:hypothetical protein
LQRIACVKQRVVLRCDAVLRSLLNVSVSTFLLLVYISVEQSTAPAAVPFSMHVTSDSDDSESSDSEGYAVENVVSQRLNSETNCVEYMVKWDRCVVLTYFNG